MSSGISLYRRSSGRQLLGLNVAIPQSRTAVGVAGEVEISGFGQPILKSSLNVVAFMGIYRFKTKASLTSIQIGGWAKKINENDSLIANYPNSVMFKCTLSYSDGTGTARIPTTYAGASSITINPGAAWNSDNQPTVDRNGSAWTLPAGTLVTARYVCYFSSDFATTGQLPFHYFASNYEGSDEKTTYSTTMDSATVTTFLGGGTQPGTNFNSGQFPILYATGTYPSLFPSIVVMSHSIGVLKNDNTGGNQTAVGWVHRWCKRASMPVINWSRDSRQIRHIYNGGVTSFEVTDLLSHCNNLVIALLTNDASNSRSLADYKNEIGAVITRVNTNHPGVKVHIMIDPPVTTSSDLYATQNGQTANASSLAIRQWLRGESGQTPVADMAALGATVSSIIDPVGQPGKFGLGAGSDTTVEYMPGGLSSGQWYIDEALAHRGDMFTVTALVPASPKTKFRSTDIPPGTPVLGNNAIQFMQKYFIWTSGPNTGQICSNANVGTDIQISATTNDITLGDTGYCVYKRDGDNVHPNASSHQVIANYMETLTFTP